MNVDATHEMAGTECPVHQPTESNLGVPAPTRPTDRDTGARNLVVVFLVVWSVVGSFYVFLTVRAITWTPAMFIDDAQYERPLATAAQLELDEMEKSKFASSPGVKHGRELYRRSGCVLCHGLAGQQGLTNKNYIKEQIPPLQKFAETLLLYEPEDIEAVLPVLAAGSSLDPEADLDVPNVAAVVAKYRDARKVVLDGNPAGKKDEKGVQPIDMPGWKERLTERDINHIFAYLLTLYRPVEK